MSTNTSTTDGFAALFSSYHVYVDIACVAFSLAFMTSYHLILGIFVSKKTLRTVIGQRSAMRKIWINRLAFDEKHLITVIQYCSMIYHRSNNKGMKLWCVRF